MMISWSYDLPTSFICSLPAVNSTNTSTARPTVSPVVHSYRAASFLDFSRRQIAFKSANYDVIPAVSRHNSVGVSARPVLSRVDAFPHPTNTDSPVSELPVIGSAAVRPDSCQSADSATPRSNNAITTTTTTTRRQQRIDLDLRHCSVGTNGSRASPASQDSTSRPAAAGRPRFGTVSTHVVIADTADRSKNGTVTRAVSSCVPRTADRNHGWSDMTVLRQMTSFTAAGHMPVTSLTTSHVTPCQRTVSIGNLSRLSDDNNNKSINNISRRDVTDRLTHDVTSPADVTGRRTTRAVGRGGVDVRRPLAATTSRQRQSVPAVQTVHRPGTTSKSITTAKNPLVKSTSQPSFLALLMSRPQPGVKDTQQTNGYTRHNNTEHRCQQQLQQQQQHLYCDDDSELSDDDVDDDVSDDDEAGKKRMIEDWLLVLERTELERPVSPVIEEDTPPQTDTAIHIVYEGD